MNKEELEQVYGGAISGSLLNYLGKIINTIFSIGQSIGSAINYLKKGRTC